MGALCRLFLRIRVVPQVEALEPLPGLCQCTCDGTQLELCFVSEAEQLLKTGFVRLFGVMPCSMSLMEPFGLWARPVSRLLWAWCLCGSCLLVLSWWGLVDEGRVLLGSSEP